MVSAQLSNASTWRPIAARTIVNAGQGGYYRVAYDAAAFAPLVEDFGRLPAADQLGLLQDGLALGMSGDQPIANYLRLAAALPSAADPLVWREQARTLAGLDGYYATGPAARQLPDLGVGGPCAGAHPRRLRRAPRRAAARSGAARNPAPGAQPDRRSEGQRRGAPALRGRAPEPDLTLRPDEHRWVLVGRAAGRRTAATFQALRQPARGARDPLERNELYVDLATVEDDALAGEVLTLALTDEAPTNFAPLLVREVADVHPELAWRFTLANLPAITHSLDALGRSTFVPRIAGASNDPKLATELSAYAAKNIPPDAQGEVQTALSTIRNNADIQARRLPQMNAWIASRTASDPSPARR